MRNAFALLTVFALLSLSSSVPAADEPAGVAAPATQPAARHHVLHGTVKKIDGNSITLTLGKGDNAKEVVVQTDGSTEFTVDHQAAKLEDLKEGQLVAVAPAEGVAHHIDVNTSGVRQHLLHGLVKKVDGKEITLTVGKGEKAKDVVVTTDDATKFTLDHQPAKLEDVKEGELAAISPADGVAHHVDINTSHKDHAATAPPAADAPK